MSIATIREVVVDFHLTKQMKTLTFMQFDTNVIKFIVEDNAVAADLSNITNIIVNFRRPDKKVISQVLTADGNEITYKLTNSEMLKIGNCELVLHLYDDDERVSIAKFNVIISENIESGEPPTVEDVRLITQIIENVNERLVELDGFGNQLTEVQNGLNNRATVEETARLSTVKADKTYVDTIVSNVSSGGPRDVFYSIAALNAAYPSGEVGTYLVFDPSYTDGAHSFIWSDETWIDLGLYQGLGIGDNTITPEKTTFIKQVASKNKYNKTTNTLNTFVNPTGGTIAESTANFTTDFIQTGGAKYLVSSSYNSGIQTLLNFRFIAEYDANGNNISFSPNGHQNISFIQLHQNTKFVRLSYGNAQSNTNIQIEFNETGEMTTYEDYVPEQYELDEQYIPKISTQLGAIIDKVTTLENSVDIIKHPLYGKKVAWLGTSITQGYAWCQLVNTYFNFNATNCGVGGTSISYESIASMCTKERLQGQYGNVTDPNTGQTTANGVAIPSDVDIIFVEGGTNDWARNWLLGTKEITYDSNGAISLNTATFYGACHQMFKNISELFPNATVIALGTPFGKMANRTAFTNKYGLINNHNLQTVQYGDALQDVAGLWGFRAFNIGRKMGVNDNNVATILPDGLHLTTQTAQNKAANVVINELLAIRK